jgi:hypothetical protein
MSSFWQLAPPKWDFDATFKPSAKTFNSPDHVAIVVRNYRWLVGLANGETKIGDLEKRFAEAPVVTAPACAMEGDSDGAPRPYQCLREKLSGGYKRRLIKDGIGHNLPEARLPNPLPKAVIDIAES